MIMQYDRAYVRDHAWIAAFTFLLGVMGTSSHAAEGRASFQPLNLDVAADMVQIDADSRTLFIGSRAANTLTVVDAQSMQLTETLKLDHELHAIILDSEGGYLYAIGSTSGAESLMRVTRYDKATGSRSVLEFTEEFISPSIAGAPDGTLYISDASSSVITVVEGEALAEARTTLERTALQNNIYLYGPASKVIYSSIDDEVIVSYAEARKIGIFDRTSGKLKGESSWDSPSGDTSTEVIPLALLLVHSYDETSLENYDTVYIGDYANGTFYTVDFFRGQYGRHAPGIKVELQPQPLRRADRGGSPFLLATDRGQEAVLVGSIYSRKLLAFRRDGVQKEGEGIVERLGVKVLDEVPRSLAVAGNGRALLRLLVVMEV